MLKLIFKKQDFSNELLTLEQSQVEINEHEEAIFEEQIRFLEEENSILNGFLKGVIEAGDAQSAKRAFLS
jgi:hypothetical protein